MVRATSIFCENLRKNILGECANPISITSVSTAVLKHSFLYLKSYFFFCNTKFHLCAFILFFYQFIILIILIFSLVQDNSCFINNYCFAPNEVHPGDWCFQCLPDVDKNTWTKRQGDLLVFLFLCSSSNESSIYVVGSERVKCNTPKNEYYKYDERKSICILRSI